MSRLLRNVVDGLGMAAFIVGPRSPAAHPLEPAGPRPDEIEHGVPEGLWNACARLRDEVLVPAMTAGRLGRLAYMDTARAIPYYKYRPRHEILDLIDQGDAALRGSLRRTEYYRDQADRLGALRALLKVYRYRRLLRSVRETGLVFDPATREGLPLFFCARDINFRLDGTHRASVARYLGYRRIRTQSIGRQVRWRSRSRTRSIPWMRRCPVARSDAFSAQRPVGTRTSTSAASS